MPSRSLEPKGPRPTIDDVARQAGVSTATVSRALRDHPYVSDIAKQRVVAAAAELRYVANPNASRLASGFSRTIGLLAPLLTSWYTSEVISGVEEVLEREEYDLLIGSANALARDRIFVGDTHFRQRVDGVLLVDVFCSEKGARRLATMDVPTVVLGESLRSVTSLSVDNRLGARLAARHVIDLGHRRIALVGGQADPSVDHNVPTERAAGFNAAMAEAALPVLPELLVDGNFAVKGGYAAGRQLLQMAQPPTAIVCMSDEMAFGVLQAARELGVQTGREVSVVGFDDHPIAEAFGLTTVRQPVRDMGRTAARLMLRHIDGDPLVHHHPMPIELVQRETTGPAPTR